MSDLHIGPASAGELGAVLDFWKTAAEGTSISDDLAGVERMHERDPGALLLARRDGELVGTVIAGFDGWRCHLYRLAVHPGHRRQGVGSALLEAAEERFAALGGRRADAMVLERAGARGVGGRRVRAAGGVEAVGQAGRLAAGAADVRGPGRRPPRDHCRGSAPGPAPQTPAGLGWARRVWSGAWWLEWCRLGWRRRPGWGCRGSARAPRLKRRRGWSGLGGAGLGRAGPDSGRRGWHGAAEVGRVTASPWGPGRKPRRR